MRASLLLLIAASPMISNAVRIKVDPSAASESLDDPHHGNISLDKVHDLLQLHTQMQHSRVYDAKQRAYDAQQARMAKVRQPVDDLHQGNISPRHVHDILELHQQMQVSREQAEQAKQAKQAQPPKVSDFASAVSEAKATWLANVSSSVASESESEASEEMSEEQVKAAWLANVDAPTWGAFAKEVLEMTWEASEVAHEEEEAKAALLAKKDVPTWGAKAAAVWEVAAKAWEVAREKEVTAAGLAELAKLDAATVWLDNPDAAAAPSATAPDDPAAPLVAMAPVVGNVSGHSEYDPWLDGVLDGPNMTDDRWLEAAHKRKRE